MFKLTRFVSKLSLTQANNVHKQIATVSSNAYKSDLSLDKLYPNSKAKIFTPLPVSLHFLYIKNNIVQIFKINSCVMSSYSHHQTHKHLVDMFH